MGWMTGVQFPPEEIMEFFFFATASRPALVPTQPLIHLVPGTLTLGVKRPERELDRLLTPSAEDKNA
jgi:hypothetical protein